MDKNIGKKLDGRYEITELIGVGGMAEVYKGVDVIDNKTVAIKILKKEYAENEEFLRRFRNESKAIAVLSHPNIVKIYDVGFSEKIQYIVMEYIDGITLKEYIEDEKVLTWKDTVHFVIQILRALQHAHDKGIVHRDIKPQNIMMFTDGTIKVMDFGIAKFAREEGKTATDQAIGSVHYISPEQASGNVTDAKSDIYSVGAMMYEMLSGRKPFDSDNPVAIAVMHMHDIPERPRAINPDIPDGLEEIVLKAMEKAPEDRYQNTAEMISDIEAFKADPTMTFGYYQEESNEDTINFQPPVNNEIQSEETAGEDQYGAGVPVYAGANAMYQNQQDMQRMGDDGFIDGGDPNGYYEGEGEEEEEEERSSLVVPVLTAVVVVVIVGAAIFVALLLSDLLKGSGKKSDYRMPDFYNVDYNEAVSQYGNNIKFEVEAQEYNELDEGRIFEQSIEPDKEFNKGDTVKVKVSKGKETVEVPRVKGINLELAKQQLKSHNLECEIKRKPDPDIPAGNVIDSDPAEGTEVAKGTKVVLRVSMGPNKGTVKVQNFVGMDLEEAVYMADYSGLTVKTEEKNSYEKKDKVVEQSIEKDEMVDQGTEITLYYSNGKDPEGEVKITANFPPDENGNPPSGRFVIDYLVQDEGSDNPRPVSTPTLSLPTYTSYTQTITGAGEKVKVKALLTNVVTGMNCEAASYTVNFAKGEVKTDSENFQAAFAQIGGYQQPETEAPTEEETDPPTEAPTEAPTEKQTQPATQAPKPTQPTQPTTKKPETVKVPSLVGMDFNQAVATYGHDFNIVSDGNPQYNGINVNGIVWQDTIVGSDVPKGTTIYVTLSKGPEPQQQQNNNEGE